MWLLSDFFPALVRDGRFTRTDFTSARVPDALGYVMDSKYLSEANANPNVTCIVTTEVQASMVDADKELAFADNLHGSFVRAHNRIAIPQPSSRTGFI
jgi:hypothetical protein